MYQLRAAADPAFLAELLVAAVGWDAAAPPPSAETVLADTRNSRYVDGWGRPGDTALCALDVHDRPVGAAWYRRFPAAAPGYGFVAADVPELAIAVCAPHRGQQVGSLLLGGLVARAGRDGERALSLSVERANPARRLYERHGFEVVGGDAGADVMALRLR